MAHYSPNPLAIDLRPSHLLAAVLAAVGTGAMTLLLWLPLPAGYQAPLVLLLFAATLYAVLHDAWRRLPWSVTALQLAADGSLRCMRRDGRWLSAQVQDSSCVTAWLTVLDLRLSGARFRRSVVLLPDCLEAEAYRKLRVWLRWGRRDQNLPNR